MYPPEQVCWYPIPPFPHLSLSMRVLVTEGMVMVMDRMKMKMRSAGEGPQLTDVCDDAARTLLELLHRHLVVP